MKSKSMLKIATKFAPEESAFRIAWQAGFRFAEFYLNPDILEDVRGITELAIEYPFEYVPHFPNKKVTKKTAQACAWLYDKLDCDAMVIHQPMIDEWGERLLQWNPNIRFAVENHYLDETQFWNWAENNPGLNLDIEHLWKFTLQDAELSKVESFLNQFLERYHEKLNHIHLPGYVPGYDEHRPMYCSRPLMETVWPLLEKYGYSFFVVSEINKQYQTYQDLRMDALLYEGWQSKPKKMKS